MKKIVLCVAITVATYAVNAQNVTFGVKGGLNLASFTENFDGPFDYKYKMGFQIGGMVKIKLADRFFLQPELLYSLQGTNYEFSLNSIILPQGPNDPVFTRGSVDGKQSESNLILPVMFKYYLAENFSVELGPQVDYLFRIKSDRIVLTDQGVVDEGDELVDESDFNFGANLGLGYDFNEEMGIGLRYNYGFNRLFKGDLAAYSNGFKRRNSVFSLNFEYRFN